MGNALVSIAACPDAIFFNAAGMRRTTRSCVLFSYGRAFGLDGLAQGAVAALVPCRHAAIGFAFRHFGNTLYSETTTALALTAPVRNRFYLGTTILLAGLYIQGYGSARTPLVDAGLAFHAGACTEIGLSLTNLGRATIGRRKEPLPRSVRAGLSWKPMEEVLAALDLVKEPPFPAEFKAGFEIRLSSTLALRTGFENQASSVAFGFGLSQGIVTLDYAVALHSILGATHIGSIQFRP